MRAGEYRPTGEAGGARRPPEAPKMTPAARRAVLLLVEHPRIPARTFGRLMWPDSWAHEQLAGKGKAGVARGRAMWLKAGSYLHYLERRGLVWGRSRSGHGTLWSATEEGERIARETAEGARASGSTEKKGGPG